MQQGEWDNRPVMALCVFLNVMVNMSIICIRALFLNISDFQRTQVRVFILQQSSIHYAIAFASSMKQVNIEITSRIESSSPYSSIIQHEVTWQHCRLQHFVAILESDLLRPISFAVSSSGKLSQRKRRRNVCENGRHFISLCPSLGQESQK